MLREIGTIHSGIRGYKVIEAVDGTPLIASAIGDRPLVFRRGRMPADAHFLAGIQGGDGDRLRSYDVALKFRQHYADVGWINIDPKKGYGDDTKPSFDRAVVENDIVAFHVGLTNHPSFMADLDNRKKVPGFNSRLKTMGKDNFGASNAYLRQAVGALGLPFTADGYIVLGVRSATAREYGGYLDTAAGYVLFPDVTDEFPDPVAHPELLDPARDARRLVAGEFGIDSNLIGSAKFLGVFGQEGDEESDSTDEFDISYFFPTSVRRDHHFTPEHYPHDQEGVRPLESLLFLKGEGDAEKFLRGELFGDENSMYSTTAAIAESLRSRLI
jgi:hypothetical protein